MNPKATRGNNKKEIAFIICTNDEDYLNECKKYIERLIIPNGYTVSLLAVENALSMTSGYNEGMHSSDARYKVYLHQDVFIINRNFISDMLDCFNSDEEIGMMGVAGAKKLPQNADGWRSLNVGGAISIGTFADFGYGAVNSGETKDREIVEFIDGLLIATSYDIDWDERIEGFHFYDVSQCVKFRNEGLKIVVTKQLNKPWTVHDEGPLNLKTYIEGMKNFCRFYPDFYYENGNVPDNSKIYELCEETAIKLEELFNNGQYNAVFQTLNELGNAIYFNQNLLIMYFLLEINNLEKMFGNNVFANYYGLTFKNIKCEYAKLRWYVIDNVFNDMPVDELVTELLCKRYSLIALAVAGLHCLPIENYDFFDSIGKCIEKNRLMSYEEWLNLVKTIREYERKSLPSAEGI